MARPPEGNAMIKILMDLALRMRLIVVGAAVLLAIAGLYSFRELDIEAYPDPV
jgi:Cu/Ag efflux pump CusA